MISHGALSRGAHRRPCQGPDLATCCAARQASGERAITPQRYIVHKNWLIILSLLLRCSSGCELARDRAGVVLTVHNTMQTARAT